MRSLTRRPSLRLLVLAAALSTTMVRPSVAADPVTNGLVGWWRFDEASGTTATDSSGTGNAGALTGAVTRVTGKVGELNLAAARPKLPSACPPFRLVHGL